MASVLDLPDFMFKITIKVMENFQKYLLQFWVIYRFLHKNLHGKLFVWYESIFQN